MQIDLSSLAFLVVEDSACRRTILRPMLQGFGARRTAVAVAMDRAGSDILIPGRVMTSSWPGWSG